MCALETDFNQELFLSNSSQIMAETNFSLKFQNNFHGMIDFFLNLKRGGF